MNATSVGSTDSFSAEDVALAIDLFGELSAKRSDERIGGGEKVLLWLRHTDTFAELALFDGSAFSGKVSVLPGQFFQRGGEGSVGAGVE